MEWNWTFASETVHAELGDHPEKRIEGLAPIKENGVRRVYHVDSLYIKQEMRRGNRLRREWESARLVASLQIPCIDYLAHGSSENGEMLISREMAGAVPLNLYLEGISPLLASSRELYRKTAAFCGRVISSGLWHPDFHAGNILYSPESGELSLVDVYGVHKRHFWDVFRKSRMEDLLSCMPLSLERDFILELHQLAGAASPELSFEKWMKRRRRWIRHDWPKRRDQLLRGYPKFASVEGSWLVKRGVSLEKLVNGTLPHEVVTGSPEELQQEFLNSFRLELLEIPCRKVLAWNRQENRLCLETCTPCADDPSDAAWPEFFKLLRGTPEHPQLCRDADGVLKINAPFPEVKP